MSNDFRSAASPLPTLAFHCRQIGELNACWNSVIRRIFGYQRSESVKAMLRGLGRLNQKFRLQLLKVEFYKRLF